jgi:hypothetical protein
MKKWDYLGDKGLLSPGSDIVELMTRKKLSMGPELWPRVWRSIRSAIDEVAQERTRNQILWELLGR